MKSAALTNGSGPGSSIALSPTSIRVRDAIIEKFIDKSLDELNSFLTSALDTERDEAKRIGILAARLYILRMRISKISEFNQNGMIPAIESVSPHELVNTSQHLDESLIEDETLAETSDQLVEWNELLTIEDGEVNGVRIPSGVAITVGKEDAARLIETGKAKMIKEDAAAEEPASEQDLLPDGELEAEPSADAKAEQSGEIPADADEETPEFSLEDTGTSVAENTPDLTEPEAHEPSSAETEQTPDAVSDEVEKDETSPQT